MRKCRKRLSELDLTECSATEIIQTENTACMLQYVIDCMCDIETHHIPKHKSVIV